MTYVIYSFLWPYVVFSLSFVTLVPSSSLSFSVTRTDPNRPSVLTEGVYLSHIHSFNSIRRKGGTSERCLLGKLGHFGTLIVPLEGPLTLFLNEVLPQTRNRVWERDCIHQYRFTVKFRIERRDLESPWLWLHNPFEPYNDVLDPTLDPCLRV